MAIVTQRLWRSGPRKVKRAAWGYTAPFAGKQVRCFREEWTKDDAEKALAARLLGVGPTPAATQAPAGMTFGQAVDRYLTVKPRSALWRTTASTSTGSR